MRPTTRPTIALVLEEELGKSEVVPEVIVAPGGQSSLPQSFEATSIITSVVLDEETRRTTLAKRVRSCSGKKINSIQFDNHVRHTAEIGYCKNHSALITAGEAEETETETETEIWDKLKALSVGISVGGISEIVGKAIGVLDTTNLTLVYTGVRTTLIQRFPPSILIRSNYPAYMNGKGSTACAKCQVLEVNVTYLASSNEKIQIVTC
ncbi:hypothetical protein K435DRAFT_809571 [Dendrothele bispora CBS 962.96]|uniref:Uncharacterized protein n=1 Tax=Dendrothele bispora (strain CBS 962.96) TaxID=1314807 RepID=A0A4S8KY79_DENBC|nr:hypothetical protein K435DRAFT_809571 [Dendrothele bispora CBS 962.96]